MSLADIVNTVLSWLSVLYHADLSAFLWTLGVLIGVIAAGMVAMVFLVVVENRLSRHVSEDNWFLGRIRRITDLIQ